MNEERKDKPADNISTSNTDNKPVNNTDQQPSQSDPQLTELDGLKKGGVDPHVHPEDRARDEDGKLD